MLAGSCLDSAVWLWHHRSQRPRGAITRASILTLSSQHAFRRFWRSYVTDDFHNDDHGDTVLDCSWLPIEGPRWGRALPLMSSLSPSWRCAGEKISGKLGGKPPSFGSHHHHFASLLQSQLNNRCIVQCQNWSKIILQRVMLLSCNNYQSSVFRLQSHLNLVLGWVWVLSHTAVIFITTNLEITVFIFIFLYVWSKPSWCDIGSKLVEGCLACWNEQFASLRQPTYMRSLYRLQSNTYNAVWGVLKSSFQLNVN